MFATSREFAIDDVPRSTHRRANLPRNRVRRVRELTEKTGHDERRLLADVDRVVADALDRARAHHHVHRPLARVRVVSDLDREPEDLAVLAIFLASPRARYITGTVIPVDGGLRRYQF